MKGKTIFWFCLPVLALLAVLAGYHDFTISRYEIVHAPLEGAARQFTDLNNWKRWHPDFIPQGAETAVNTGKGKQEIAYPGGIVRIQLLHAAAVLVTRVENNKTTNFSLTALPYRDGSSTYVAYAQVLNGFGWLQQKISGQDDIQPVLKGLQLLAEDDSRRYGFSITTVPVTDTLILTTRVQVPEDSILNNIQVLHRRLKNYCRMNRITIPQNYYYLSTRFLAGGRAELAAGIPVHTTAVSQHRDFEFLKLPVNGRLVAGRYSGQYAGKHLLYEAMTSYMLDKHLKKVAQPLEQYRDTDTTFTAGSTVSMQVFFPVY